MARTFNRYPMSVNTPDKQDIKDYFFNQYNWKGICEDKNYLAVDQYTSADAKNVYVDDEGMLRSRPSLKAFDNTLGKILDVQLFGKLTVYYTYVENDLFPYKLHILDGERDTIHYFDKDTKYKLIYKEGKLFIFLAIGLFYYVEGSYQIQNANGFIYIPETTVDKYGVKTSVETKNALTDQEIINYLYDSTTVPNYLFGKTLHVEILGNDYTIVFDENSTLVIVGEVANVTGYDKKNIEVSSKGAFLLYNPTTKTIYYSQKGKVFNVAGTTDNPADTHKPHFSKDGELIYYVGTHNYSDGSSRSDLYYKNVSVIGTDADTEFLAYSERPGIVWTKQNDIRGDRLFVNSETEIAYAYSYYLYNDNIHKFGACFLIDNVEHYTEQTGSIDNNFSGDFGKLEGKYAIVYSTTSTPTSTNFKERLEMFVYDETTDKVLYNAGKNNSMDSSYKQGAYSIRIANNSCIKVRALATQVGIHYNKQTITYSISNDTITITISPDRLIKFYDIDGFGLENWFNPVISYDGTIFGLYAKIPALYLDSINTEVPLLVYNAGTKIYTIDGTNVYYYYDNKILSNNFDGEINLKEYVGTGYNYLLPEYVADLEATYLSKDKTLYISEARYDEDGNFLWYLPKRRMQEMDYEITNIHPISTTEMAIFMRDAIWYSSYDQSSDVHRYYKSKLQVGLMKGSEVITSIDGKAIIFPSDRGLVALTYQDFVASTEQTLSYLSDNIYTIFKEYVKEPVKLTAYSFWIVCYKQTSKQFYLYDLRSASWWLFELPYIPTKLYNTQDEIRALCDNKICWFNKSDNDYYDFEETRKMNEYGLYDDATLYIDWFITSQKLYLGAINYVKHIVNMTFNFVLDHITLDDAEEKPSFVLIARNYRKKFNFGNNNQEGQTIQYTVDLVRTYVQRMSYPKVDAFQYTIKSDPESYRPVPLSLASLTVKYKIGGGVR